MGGEKPETLIAEMARSYDLRDVIGNAACQIAGIRAVGTDAHLEARPRGWTSWAKRRPLPRLALPSPRDVGFWLSCALRSSRLQQEGGASHMTSDYEVLTPKEVCEMLHIHRATLYKLMRKGKLPGFKIGGDWRFRTDLLERWMAEQMLEISARYRHARNPGRGAWRNRCSLNNLDPDRVYLNV